MQTVGERGKGKDPLPSLRVALVGKGGAGKSVIAGTLARALARRGHRVLALDVDTMPGLAYSLGLPAGAVGDAGLPEELGERREGEGWVLREGEDVRELVAGHAVVGPDGVRFLQLGKLPDRVKPGSTTAFRAVLEGFREEGWTLVGDLAAGTRQPFFGWGDFAEVVLVVVEPSAKAILSARRLTKLAAQEETEQPRAAFGLVANKLRTPDDLQLIEGALGEQGQGRHEGRHEGSSSPFGRSGATLPLRVVGAVPYDEQLAAAERLGRAPIDAAPEAPAVVAIQELAARLEAGFPRGDGRR